MLCFKHAVEKCGLDVRFNQGTCTDYLECLRLLLDVTLEENGGINVKFKS